MKRVLNRTLKANLLIALILISACCTTQPSVGVLPLPPRLVVPVVRAEQLQCVSDRTYREIKLQAEMRKARIKTLENIIKSTWINK